MSDQLTVRIEDGKVVFETTFNLLMEVPMRATIFAGRVVYCPNPRLMMVTLPPALSGEELRTWIDGIVQVVRQFSGVQDLEVTRQEENTSASRPWWRRLR